MSQELERQIKHVLNQMAHGHYVRAHVPTDINKPVTYWLHSPHRRGLGFFGREYRAQQLSLDIVTAMMARGLLRRYSRGALVKTKLTRKQVNRKWSAREQGDRAKLARRAEKRNNPVLFDVYYRESEGKRWKLYNKKAPYRDASAAWRDKRHLSDSPKTKAWQVVVIAGNKDIRLKDMAQRLLDEVAKREFTRTMRKLQLERLSI